MIMISIKIEEFKYYHWLKNQIDKFFQLSKHQQKLLEEINYEDFENQSNSWKRNYSESAESPWYSSLCSSESLAVLRGGI